MALLAVLCISTLSVGIPAFAETMEDPGEDIAEEAPSDPIGILEVDAEIEEEDVEEASEYLGDADPTEESMEPPRKKM